LQAGRQMRLFPRGIKTILKIKLLSDEVRT